jgi:4a-hydroxytetrahydrobiopterin dehydratase
MGAHELKHRPAIREVTIFFIAGNVSQSRWRCNAAEANFKKIGNELANDEAHAAIFRGTFPTYPMSELLEDDDLTAALKKCPEWDYEKKAITRTVEFEEFMDAIDFVNDLAEIAEEAQHHPDITIKHTKVSLKLTSDDVGGVTELDIELAQRVDNLVD